MATMKNELNIKTTAFAVATTSALIYGACVVLLRLFGLTAISFFAKMFHGIDITKMAVINVSWGDALVGFMEIVVAAFLVGAVFAKIYNVFAKRE